MNIQIISRWWLWGKVTEAEAIKFLDDLGYTAQEIDRILTGWRRACEWADGLINH